MKKILLIEDDFTLNKLIKDYIEKYDYAVSIIEDFTSIEDEFLSVKPDLILLDVNLPYSDGFQLCKSFRRHSNVPIIFISARSSYSEQIRALELGGDDYIVKPFDIELLLAKIQVAFRRVYGEYSGDKNEVAASNGLVLSKHNLQVSFNGKSLELSKKEFQLINKLVINENSIIPREELLEELWDETFFVDDHTLTVNVARVKNKLSLLGLKDAIQTKRGYGYLFVSEKKQ